MAQQAQHTERRDLPEKTIVFVTDQFQCERLIKTGRGLADFSNTELEVISIQLESRTQNPLAIEHLFEVSREHGSTMKVLYSQDVFRSMVSCIKQSRTVNVVTGVPGDEDSVLYRVFRKFTHVSFFTVAPDGEISTVSKFKRA